MKSENGWEAARWILLFLTLLLTNWQLMDVLAIVRRLK